MTTHPLNPVRSEKGIALIVVLLLLGVMAGLTTGLSMNSQTEIAMASNELSYAGARAAAEAGMNRAIERITADTSTDLLATGVVPGINSNGPFTLTEGYTYSFQILDDDDPLLYNGDALSPEAQARMNEDGVTTTDNNDYLVLRSIGTGPRGTTVTISRILQSVEKQNVTTTQTTVISNPAVLVNGNLDLDGNGEVWGSRGNVHANGNITGGGSFEVEDDLTATGSIDPDLEGGQLTAGGMPAITVPEIKASDYRGLADWILKSDGSIRRPSDNALCGTSGVAACPTGWTPPASGNGTWSASGSMPSSSTYYVEGNVEIHGTGNSSFTNLSLIAEGNIQLSGNGKFKPENSAKIQFVTNGDFILLGTSDANDSADQDGQIMVREQIKIQGNTEFQGRVMVEDRNGANNAWHETDNPNGNRGSSSLLTANTLSGNMSVQYNGSLGDITSIVTTITNAPPSYTNNISGWIER